MLHVTSASYSLLQQDLNAECWLAAVEAVYNARLARKAVVQRPLLTAVCWHVQVRMHVHRRSARLGYFPAYHLHYVHGEKYTPSRADIVPARYDALIGAADKQPRVCAELHPSPIKSQVCWLALAVCWLYHARLPFWMKCLL